MLSQDAKALVRCPMLWIVALACVAIVVAYSSTFADMAHKWLSDASYQHGLVVPFISIWLAWRVRSELSLVPFKPSWFGVPVLLAIGVVWLVARAVDIKVIEQLAATALIPVTVVTLLGSRAGRVLAFPLAFLLLAVPIGQALVPFLMQFTADFTVAALRASGIPVFREGVFFSVPAGHFEVAKACSGVRYLSASFAFGALFAYLMLRSASRRALFVLLSIVVPIIANGIRAYLIVLIASLSDMRYGVSVDHIVYGWIFFAPVIALLLWIGLRMSKREQASQTPPAPSSTIAATGSSGLFPVHVVATLLAILAAPLLFRSLDRATPKPIESAAVAVQLPDACAPWSAAQASGVAWQPDFKGALANATTDYVGAGGARISAYRAVYQTARDGGSEMISAGNQLEGGGEERRTFPRTLRLEMPAAAPLRVGEATVSGAAGEMRLAWFWYDIGSERTSSPVRAKALEAWYFLRRVAPEERVTVISTPIFTENAARSLLEEFLRMHAPTFLARTPADAAATCT
jgi:exosortase A